MTTTEEIYEMTSPLARTIERLKGMEIGELGMVDYCTKELQRLAHRKPSAVVSRQITVWGEKRRVAVQRASKLKAEHEAITALANRIES